MHFTNIVIGAGISGLAIALKLKELGRDVLIIEQNGHVGGHARSFKIGHFFVDLGPHILRITSKKMSELLDNLIGLDNFRECYSNPKIWKYNHFFDNVIPTITTRNIRLLSKLKGKYINFPFSKNSETNVAGDSFEEILTRILGQELYYEFFGEYSEKWWGVPGNMLDPIIVPKNLNIGSKPRYTHLTLPSSFLKEVYPKYGGFHFLPKKIAEKCQKLGVFFLMNTKVDKIEISRNDEYFIYCSDNITYETTEIRTKGNIFITCPLDKTAQILGVEPPNLRYRGILFSFFAIEGESRFYKFSWLYLHEKKLIAARVYDVKYFTKNPSTQNYTVICIEIPTGEEGKSKSMELARKAFQQLKDEKLLKVKKIFSSKVLYEPYSYPLFLKGYFNELNRFRNKVCQNYNGIYLEGRNGRFEYLNTNNLIDKYLLTDYINRLIVKK